eukprot:6729-Chlamydomonas_euryale.AAC.1
MRRLSQTGWIKGWMDGCVCVCACVCVSACVRTCAKTTVRARAGYCRTAMRLYGWRLCDHACVDGACVTRPVSMAP